MSKAIVIPELGRHPIRFSVNGKTYGPYKVGESASVPDEVAAMIEELVREQQKKKVPPDPDAAPATIGDVKALETALDTTLESLYPAVQEMISDATTPVTLDLSDEDSGLTFDDEAGEYVGDESIDWSPLIESVKAGKVWLVNPDGDDSSGEAVSWWAESVNRVSGDRYFAFAGPYETSYTIRLPIPSSEDEDEGEGTLAPLPVIPGGMVSLKLPTTNSGA